MTYICSVNGNFSEACRFLGRAFDQTKNKVKYLDANEGGRLQIEEWLFETAGNFVIKRDFLGLRGTIEGKSCTIFETFVSESEFDFFLNKLAEELHEPYSTLMDYHIPELLNFCYTNGLELDCRDSVRKIVGAAQMHCDKLFERGTKNKVDRDVLVEEDFLPELESRFAGTPAEQKFTILTADFSDFDSSAKGKVEVILYKVPRTYDVAVVITEDDKQKVYLESVHFPLFLINRIMWASFYECINDDMSSFVFTVHPTIMKFDALVEFIRTNDSMLLLDYHFKKLTLFVYELTEKQLKAIDDYSKKNPPSRFVQNTYNRVIEEQKKILELKGFQR